jgi:hypothetical protein
MYYFYDCNDVQQLYKDLQECIRDAKKDGTCAKVRDTLGGEYWFQSNLFT